MSASVLRTTDPSALVGSFLHLVERQNGMGRGTICAHLGTDPNCLHELCLAGLVAQRRLGMALEAIGALGDRGDRHDDQLLGLLIQCAIGKDGLTENLERFRRLGRQVSAVLSQITSVGGE